MTRGRASLAALAAVALLAGVPAAASADAKAPAKRDAGTSSAAAKKRAVAKRAGAKRAKAKRMRWRSRTVAFRTGAGFLFGGTGQGGSGAPGSPVPGGGSQPGSPTGPAPEYHAVSVAAREYSLTLSRPVLTPGLQTIQLNNRGEDPHDLVISLEDSHAPLADFPETPSEENHTEQVPLPAGRYRLWCSLPGHEALGMKATLRVE